MKSFSKWTIAEVEETFDLTQCKDCELLTRWLDKTETASLTPEEEHLLTEFRAKLVDHIWDWNEWELKGKFIFPLLAAVNFDQEKYQSFIEREISVEIEDDMLSGMVDFFVANGRRYPKHPYFFIHEFKKEHDASGDPLGQLLITMVAAQKLNNDGKPVYGCYVMGRLWFFVVLDGQDYATSLALDSLDEPDAVQEKVLQKAHQLLDDAMGRKRSSGYLLSEKPVEAITPSQSGNSGRMLGRVKGIQEERSREGKNRLTFQVILAAQVSEGDRLRLHDEQSGNRFSFTLRSLQVRGKRQKTAHAGQKAQLSFLVSRKEHIHGHFQGTLFKVDVGSRITAEKSGHKRQKKLSSQKVVPDMSKVDDILAQLAWKRGPVNFKPAETPQGRQGKKKGGGRRTGRKEPSWWLAVAQLNDLRQRMP
ncbi:MAG: hypothetical protein D3916_16145, partial [Candidatus Electrothrix sp. MAN1_4]|nr:hypothetical protein [Candidatus Electrothrix sp. MAN1_4]